MTYSHILYITLLISRNDIAVFLVPNILGLVRKCVKLSLSLWGVVAVKVILLVATATEVQGLVVQWVSQ